MNQKLMTTCRKYSKDIPIALYQRPHPFIKHVMSRIGLSKLIPKETLQGYNTSVESCDCYDFSNNSYPCKHIIHLWTDQSGRFAVPDGCNLRPWIEVDSSVVGEASIGFPHVHVHDPQPLSPLDNHSFSDTEPPQSIELPSTESSTSNLTSALSDLRQKLDMFKAWTYRTESAEHVTGLLNALAPLELQYNITEPSSLQLPKLADREMVMKRRKISKLSSGSLKRHTKKKAPLQYRYVS